MDFLAKLKCASTYVCPISIVMPTESGAVIPVVVLGSALVSVVRTIPSVTAVSLRLLANAEKKTQTVWRVKMLQSIERAQAEIFLAGPHQSSKRGI
jgi:hypothetical protein